MKKAKIMLAAIAVLGIAGGAVALKTQKLAAGFYTGTPGSVTCTFVAQVTTTDVNDGQDAAVKLVLGAPGQTTTCDDETNTIFSN